MSRFSVVELPRGRQRVNISLDAWTLDLIDRTAQALGVSRSRLIVTCFRYWCSDYRTRTGNEPWAGTGDDC